MVLFQQEGRIFQVPADQWKPVYDQFAEQCRTEHDEVIAMGGLHILGTERHEARRIDNQLRGRAGRQGDPGASRFFLSLEDDLLRIFGGEKVKAMMHWLGMTEGVPIESKMISKRIENAQKAVEAQNFEARKHLLEYDDVMNKQRETVYGLRRGVLEGADQKEYILERADSIAMDLAEKYCPREINPGQWNTAQFTNEVLNQFGLDGKALGIDFLRVNHDEVVNTLLDRIKARYDEKEQLFGAPVMRWLERRILLDIVDTQWKDHLLTLDHLKEGIGLRGYGQKDPLVEFKREGFTLFEEMMDRIDTESVRFLFLVRPAENEQGAPTICGGQPGASATEAIRNSAATRKTPAAATEGSSISGRPGAGGSTKAGARGRQSRAQRRLPLRLRQKIQEVPRRERLRRGSKHILPLPPTITGVQDFRLNYPGGECVSTAGCNSIYAKKELTMRIRSRWELSILVIAAMLTLAAITPQPALADSRGHFDKTLTVTGAVDLDVQTGSGDITVHPGDSITSKSTPRFAPATRSSAVMSMRASSRSKSNPPVVQEGNTIRIGHSDNRDLFKNISISYDIKTPKQTQLRSKSGSGDETIDGIAGPVEASSGSGTMKIHDIGAEVHASTGSGDVEIQNAQGKAHVSSGSGTIRATGIAGALSVPIRRGGGVRRERQPARAHRDRAPRARRAGTSVATCSDSCLRSAITVASANVRAAAASSSRPVRAASAAACGALLRAGDQALGLDDDPAQRTRTRIALELPRLLEEPLLERAGERGPVAVVGSPAPVVALPGQRVARRERDDRSRRARRACRR